MKVNVWPNGAPEAHIIPYLLETNRPQAAVIVCPGGGYKGLAGHEGEPVANWLNGIGLSAFVLKYRVHPYQHPQPLADAQRAIQIVRSRSGEWNLDPGRIGILGFSAGGHLAASTGAHFLTGNPAAADPIDKQSSRPDLTILCYPVISFLKYVHTDSKQALLGKEPAKSLVRSMSLETCVGPDTPPAFLWHTTDDPGVPVGNSLLYAAALNQFGIPYELHTFESGRHGLGLAKDHPEAYAWTGLCERWLKKRGFTRHSTKKSAGES